MWAVDVVLSFPRWSCDLGRRFRRHLADHISLVLGFSLSRVRPHHPAHTLTVGKREFITAPGPSRPTGASSGTRWCPTCCRSPLVRLTPSVVIVVEGSLSFLGLSVSAPPLVGGIIASGQSSSPSPSLVWCRPQ